MFKITSIILIICASQIVADLEGPQVKIKQGTLVGKIETTDKGRAFKAFTGIPYAKPPVGEYRFEPPQPVDSWDGIYDATRPHNVCPQIDMFFLRDNKIVGDEDCLYLNVYVPQLSEDDAEKTLPVMIYIHGGGWVTGSAGSDFYGPEYLLDKDIILVTINYRLGPLGFFTTGDKLVPGNNGLKDQAFAIKWVRKNIGYFGGDPESITLFGQSAGGASAHYQAISPLNKGLIKGVISQSGTALNIWSLGPIPVVGIKSRALGGIVGCPANKNKEMVKCLKEIEAYDIINATQKLVSEVNIESMMLFKPIIEPAHKGSFLSNDPLDIISSGKLKNIAFMTGLTADDGAIVIGEDMINKLNEDFRENAPSYLGYGDTAILRNKNKITKDIKEFYFKKEAIDESKRSTVEQMFTDAIFLEGAHASVDMHTKYSDKPVYYYLFNYRGTESYCKIAKNPSEGVCHCDDLLYLFKHKAILPDFKPNESERKMIDLMTTLWTNFATYGNPTPPEDQSVSVQWKPAEKNNRYYYHIKRDGTVELEEDLYSERAEFWKMLSVDSRRVRIRDEL